ncbi:MAG: helix-turn-helix domain-containing protein [Janthinobacterium lividum]
MGFAHILDEFRNIVRQELALLQAPHASSTDEVGGLKLAVEITRLSKSRVYALVQQRGIPHSKRGNKLYFNRAELLAWVEEGKRQEKK